jgi:hypothetical protein
VKGGERTLRRWHRRWRGSPASLKRRAGSGKAPLLSRAQLDRHVCVPILAANRRHRAISYPQLLPGVRAATGTQLSLRTLQRYGKKELRARAKRTIKRTSAECECNASSGRDGACLQQLTRAAVSASLCEEIAQMRRKLQKRDKAKLPRRDCCASQRGRGSHHRAA